MDRTTPFKTHVSSVRRASMQDVRYDLGESGLCIMHALAPPCCSVHAYVQDRLEKALTDAAASAAATQSAHGAAAAAEQRCKAAEEAATAAIAAADKRRSDADVAVAEVEGRVAAAEQRAAAAEAAAAEASEALQVRSQTRLVCLLYNLVHVQPARAPRTVQGRQQAASLCSPTTLSTSHVSCHANANSVDCQQLLRRTRARLQDHSGCR